MRSKTAILVLAFAVVSGVSALTVANSAYAGGTRFSIRFGHGHHHAHHYGHHNWRHYHYFYGYGHRGYGPPRHHRYYHGKRAQGYRYPLHGKYGGYAVPARPYQGKTPPRPHSGTRRN